MLTALGVPADRIPGDDDERGSMYWTLLRDRRTLIVLDNAANEAQVRPLLGSAEHALTIVTSRNTLAGLESARWLLLDVLSTAGAIDLLVAIAGEDRVRKEPDSTNEVVALCGGLPLALRIVGNRLAAMPLESVADLVQQMRDDRARLDLLSVGDLHLRTAFEVSMRRLSPMAQMVFRRLALIPGAHFDGDLATVATDVSHDKINGCIDELVEASLLNITPAAGRLQYHDLLRLFALEHLVADEPEHERDRLRDNLFTHVLSKTCAAGTWFYPGVLQAQEGNPFQSQPEAVAWLDEEATNWLAVQREAAKLGRYQEVLDLAWSLHRYSHGRHSRYRWDEVFGIGVHAAVKLGDQRAAVDLLTQLSATLLWGLDVSEDALGPLREALTIADEIGNHRGATVANSCMGQTLARLGRAEEGLEYCKRSCEMSERYDFFDVGFWTASAMGGTLEAAGRFDESLVLQRGLLAEVELRSGQTNEETAKKMKMLAVSHVGDCLAGLGHWEEAARSFHEARVLATEKLGGYAAEAGLTLQEGIAWRHAGQYEHARMCLLFARELFDEPMHRKEMERVDEELALLPD